MGSSDRAKITRRATWESSRIRIKTVGNAGAERAHVQESKRLLLPSDRRSRSRHGSVKNAIAQLGQLRQNVAVLEKYRERLDLQEHS